MPRIELTPDDLRRLTQIVADENARLGLKDEQVQRIETNLDSALLEHENFVERLKG